MKRWLYEVRVDHDVDGWRAVVAGVERVWVGGPHASADAAHAAVHALVLRWRDRARALGGHVWRPGGTSIGVALPDGVVPRDAIPFQHAPVSRAPGGMPVAPASTKDATIEEQRDESR